MFLFPRNEVGPHLLAVELATTLAVTPAHTSRFDHAATGHYCCFPFTATVTSFPKFLSTTRARMSEAHLHWLRLCHSSGKCPKQAGPTKPAESQASKGCSARSLIYVCTFTQLDSLHPWRRCATTQPFSFAIFHDELQNVRGLGSRAQNLD